MRARKALVTSLWLGALALAIGCGRDIAPKLSCSDAAACLSAAKNLYSDVDASVAELPRCCAGTCVVATIGCDTGFRYLTSEPALGACAVAPMCPALPDLGSP